MWFSTTDVTLQIKVVLLAVNCLFLLAVAGSPAIALASQLLAGMRNKVFYDKFGSQLSLMALVLALCTLPLTAGQWAYLYVRTAPPVAKDLFPTLYDIPAAVVFAILGASFLLVLLYRMTWKLLKQARWLHMLIGLVCTISAICSTVLFLAVERTHFLFGGAIPADTTAVDFLLFLLPDNVQSLFWPFAAFVVLCSLLASASLGLVFLLIRRTRDDFGRDYYNFVLRYCSAWAIVSAILCWAPLFWLGYKAGLTAMPEALYTAIGGFACTLLAMILWIVVRRSDNPLRNKPAILGGMLLTLLAGIAFGLSLVITGTY